jgi:hypothetical protein
MNDNNEIEKCSCGCEEHEHEHGESCGCDCGCEEHGSFTVDLEDENGNVVTCEVIDGFVFNDSEFALVQNPEDGSVYLFKVVGEGEEGELVVPEDEEFEAATAYYESTLENEE